MFEMKDEFYTGIEEVDREHAKLFEIIRSMYALVRNEYISDKYDAIISLLQELKEYTVVHFSHEEAYMESIGYKKLFSQKMDHQMFIKKLESVDLSEMDTHQDETIMDLLTFLYDWLDHHILEKDKLIGM